jgi:predicted metal-dependent phosphoesterase TrpH
MLPTSTVDLHIHTHYSDGLYSPADVLRHAARIGLETIALTDHDNTGGVREALPLARELGLELIPAVEFTCRWPACDAPPGHGDVDVLGYFVDLDDPEFRAFERATLDDAHARTADCCARLSAAGHPLSLDDAFAENPRYAGVLQLVLAVQTKGYAEGWEAAVQLVVEHWVRVRLSRFTIQQVIASIHRAGGVAVLAHPTTVKCGGDGLLEADQLAPLVEAGLDGLEIYHFRLDEPARAHFLALARQFDLLVSGGSDTHGLFNGLGRVGTQPVTPDLVESLRARSVERKT